MSTHFVTREVVERTSKTIRVELLHCPFCGGRAEFRESTNCYHGVRCTECKALSAMKHGVNGQIRAAEVWNRRAEA